MEKAIREDQVEILEYNFTRVSKNPDRATLDLIAAEAGLSVEEVLVSNHVFNFKYNNFHLEVIHSFLDHVSPMLPLSNKLFLLIASHHLLGLESASLSRTYGRGMRISL